MREGDWGWWLKNEVSRSKQEFLDELQRILDVETVIVPEIALRISRSEFDVLFLDGVTLFEFVPAPAGRSVAAARGPVGRLGNPREPLAGTLLRALGQPVPGKEEESLRDRFRCLAIRGGRGIGRDDPPEGPIRGLPGPHPFLHPRLGGRHHPRKLLRFAIEGRKRVKDQLMRIDSTYEPVRFAYLDASRKAKLVTTLEEQEYPHYYRKTIELDDAAPGQSAAAEAGEESSATIAPSSPSSNRSR